MQHFLLALLSAALCVTNVFAQPSVNEPPLSVPVIEVAVFRVSPVAQGASDTRAKGNTTSGNSAVGVVSGAGRVLEMRAQKGEDWPTLFQRIAQSLATPLPAGVKQAPPSTLPKLQAGKYLRVITSVPSAAENILELEYIVTQDEAYQLLVSGAAMRVRKLDRDPNLLARMRADPSKASLFTATDAVGLPETMALQLTEIFAGEVDFLRELHLGYRCAIVYEAHYREGFIERSGRILAAELEVGKRTYRAYLSPDAQGRATYFDETGKTTQRLFRKSPLEFTRITSDFTLARFHPILGVWTAHRGVDYAAPIGTKVMAVADGVVEFVGERGGYGNLVILRHQDNKFRTYYAHLNNFAPKLAVGDKVTQGQTIAFVGTTGLSTGPHLHFEFHVRDAKGEWISVPAPNVIDSTILSASGFNDLVKRYRNSLTAQNNDNLLILE